MTKENIQRVTEQLSAVLIKESSINGRGSFAAKDIEAGEIIEIFTGKVVTGFEASQMVERGEYRLGDEVQIDRDLFLIPDEYTVYLNHCCDPNSGVRDERELFALKDIKVGEEITFDYSIVTGLNQEPSWPNSFNNITWSMECNCGVQNCRQQIGNVSTVPKETLRKYLEFGALPDFIKCQIKESNLL